MSANDPAAPPQPTIDLGLECPACGYNLTGLAANRCPECGGTFDPAELQRLCSPEIQPATPWDQRARGGFWATWKLAAFAPTRLARNFPSRHDSYRAASYALECFAMTCAVFVLPTIGCAIALEGAWGVLALFPIAFVYGCGVLAACVSTFSVGLVIAALVRPTLAPERFHFWCGLTHYASGFFILSGACGAVALVGAMRAESPQGGVHWIIAFAGASAGVVFLWWCIALCQMIRCRSLPGAERVLACMSVPVVGLMIIGVTAELLWSVFT